MSLAFPELYSFDYEANIALATYLQPNQVNFQPN
jgi:hypothetical protein